MPRCKSCASCIAVTSYRVENAGKKNVKKVKSFENKHPCVHPTAQNKKRQVTEMDLLASGGSGSRMRSDVFPVPTPLVDSDSKARAAHHDGSYNDDIGYDQVAFDKYAQLVLQCSEISKITTSSDVKLETPSMISKMRGLLDPKVKAEVDYEEAAKDASNVWLQWSQGHAAGKRAFIPTIEDRNECFAALKIFSHAGDEAKLIPKEFCKEFGNMGISIYNDLVGMIGERDRNCLPFVNMCLRIWLEHLKADPDLWADTYLFDFDKWVAEKMAQPMSTQCDGLTSYELMMAVFGEKVGKLADATSSQTTAAVSLQTADATSAALSSRTANAASSRTTDAISRQPADATHSPTANPASSLTTNTCGNADTSSYLTADTASSLTANASNSRDSKLKQIGNMVMKRLRKSNTLRGQRYPARAKAEINALIAITDEDDLKKSAMRSCREAARKMEKILFSVGGAKRLVTTLRYFRERPVVRELGQTKNLLEGNKTGKYSTKEEQLQCLVLSGIKNFFAMFHRPRGEEGKGGGRRTIEDQNAYDAVMTALNSNELTSARLGRLLTNTLGVSHRQIKRGQDLRKSMEDQDKGWVRRKSVAPKNAVKDEHKAAISEFLHSTACSRIDNNDKTPAIVDLGIDPDTGARIYDLHDRREVFLDDNEILDVLTGRNRFDENAPNEPHPIWDEVKRSTTCPKSRPNGITGSTKLIRSCKCPCMKKMKPSVCSCTICERYKDGIRRFGKYQVSWRNQAIEKRKRRIVDTMEEQLVPSNDIQKYLDDHADELQCQACNKSCHPKSAYQTFSTSPSICASALLCEKVHIPDLDIPKIDINFREIPGEVDKFYIHCESCCYGTHCGFTRNGNGSTTRYPKCGWDATFKDMPLHERIEIDEKTKEEVTHRIRACPDEYCRDGEVIWMDFLKVARSGGKPSEDDDDDYGCDDGVKFQTEWLPVKGTTPQFFEHLDRSIQEYLAHAYEIKLSGRVDKLAERAFIIDPVAREDCPAENKGVVNEVVDFASDIHAKRKHDVTCSFPETHKCEVHHLTFAPKFVSVDEIALKHPRSAKALTTRGVDRVLRPRNVVMYAFGKAKGSAAYNQTVTTNLISIVKYGKLPDDSKCEAFLDQKRIVGGDRSDCPNLPDPAMSKWGGLSEWDGPIPLYPETRRWRRSRDGCAAQYQGKSAFLGWQSMKCRHGLECEDRRKVTMHGKDIADGDGSAVSGMVKKSFDDDYGEGSRNLVRHLATKYPRPKTERHTRYYGEKGLYATTDYIYMFVPEDAIDEKLVAVDVGYSGSSKDHYYRSMGATEEAASLKRRERACGCQPCLRLLPGCTLTRSNINLKGGTTAKASNVVLLPARPTPEARHTRNGRNPLPEFCKKLKVGENVIVRVANEERLMNQDEEYFVAKIEQDALQLNEAGMYSAVAFKKNDWIVSVRWYLFAPSKTNKKGDRFYKKGYSGWIPCNSIIRCLKKPIELKWGGQYYKLEKALNDHIEGHGDISY